jgi:hypothetical protein
MIKELKIYSNKQKRSNWSMIWVMWRSSSAKIVAESHFQTPPGNIHKKQIKKPFFAVYNHGEGESEWGLLQLPQARLRAHLPQFLLFKQCSFLMVFLMYYSFIIDSTLLCASTKNNIKSCNLICSGRMMYR